jgi:hypothetical protein
MLTLTQHPKPASEIDLSHDGHLDRAAVALIARAVTARSCWLQSIRLELWRPTELRCDAATEG